MQFGREAPALSVFSVERLASEELVFQRKLCVFLQFLSLPVRAQAVKSPSFHHGSPFRFQTSLCRIHGEGNGSMLRFLWNASVLHRPYLSVSAPSSCICCRKYIIVEVDNLILILIFLIMLKVCTYYEAPQCGVFTWQGSLQAYGFSRMCGNTCCVLLSHRALWEYVGTSIVEEGSVSSSVHKRTPQSQNQAYVKEF